MNFEQIKELINIIDSSSLAFFEINTADEHVKMDKSLNRNNKEVKSNNVLKEEIKTDRVESNKDSISDIVNDVVKESKGQENNNINDEDCIIIKSPMVGTFYSKPSPDSPSFANIGDKISNGQIICIIEAMKLMNEIESEFEGTVVSCLVKDGEMVEYGQPLFKVKGE